MVGGLAGKSTGIVLDVAKQRGGVEPSTVTLHDHSRFGNHGVMTNVTWVQIPPYGLWVMNLNGTAYVDCGRGPSLDMGTGDFTLLVWIKLTDVTAHRTVLTKGSRGVGGKRYELIVLQTTGTLYCSLDDNTNHYEQTGATDVSDGVWHLVGFSADRDGNLSFYIDGAVEGTPTAITATLTLDDTNKDLCIGVISDDEASFRFLGNMALAYIYKYFLTPLQIRAKFAATRRLLGV